MKTIFISITILLCCLAACTSNSNKNTKPEIKVNTVISLTDTTDNGVVTEYYPGRKVKKLTGRLDKDGKRHETWYYFKNDGSTGSATTYFHGKKHGHTIVYHPNGALHYKGEYSMDEKIKEWKFYDQQGALVKTEQYK
ncbi:MAG: hypothetical protein ACPGU5_06265 [Lishizhenia sp.]